jgi:hypothetical protein
VSVRHLDGGGTLNIDSAMGDVVVAGSLSAAAAANRPGGSVTVTAAGNVTLSAPIFAMPGGDVSVAADGLLTAEDDVRIACCGTIMLHGGSLHVSSTALVHADLVGFPAGGGEIRMSTDVADMTLSGVFLARAEGVIEGSAAGNLVADGVFRTAPGGCIGLSAGGTLDTSDGSFDGTVVASCP